MVRLANQERNVCVWYKTQNVAVLWYMTIVLDNGSGTSELRMSIKENMKQNEYKFAFIHFYLLLSLNIRDHARQHCHQLAMGGTSQGHLFFEHVAL